MIHLIHGIHPSQPGGTISKLIPHLGNNMFMMHSYGSAYAVTARFLNPGRAKKIAEFVASDDIIIGHSNGCAIAHLIQKKRPVYGLVLINPALDSDAKFDRVNWVHVYHNWGDEAVPLSNILFAHPWGDMGQRGYTGADSRVTNFDGCDKSEIVLPCLDGHSDFFEPGKIESWSNFMLRNIENAYAGRSETKT